MSGRWLLVCGIAWLGSACQPAGVVQTPEELSVRQELAAKYFELHDFRDALEDAREDSIKYLSELVGQTSPEAVSWKQTALPAAFEHGVEAVLPMTKAAVIKRFANEMNVEELQHIVEWETIMRRPDMKRIFERADALPRDQRRATLISSMPPGEYQRVFQDNLQTDEKHVRLLKRLNGELGEPILQEMEKSLKLQCATAPPDITFCRGS